MTNIDCLVDTKPMAREISTVSDHVTKTTSAVSATTKAVVATTAAVVAMQTAVVAAEKEAADHVCENVNRGFYTMIRSQISQKMAKLQSDVDSHLMKLNQHQKQLLAIKSRMERDYNNISNRYGKIFNTLNKNLKQRVFELDKPTIKFAVKEIDQISNRTKYLSATVPISQDESMTISQKIMASNIKYRGSNVIGSMSNFLMGMAEQKLLTDRILLSNLNNENAQISVPIVIQEKNYDSMSKNIEVTVNPNELSKQTQSAIKNTVTFNMENYNWENNQEVNAEIKSEFSKLLSNNNASQRVKDMTNKLFQSSNFQTLRK